MSASTSLHPLARRRKKPAREEMNDELIIPESTQPTQLFNSGTLTKTKNRINIWSSTSPTISASSSFPEFCNMSRIALYFLSRVQYPNDNHSGSSLLLLFLNIRPLPTGSDDVRGKERMSRQQETPSILLLLISKNLTNRTNHKGKVSEI